ncbi:MAG: DNA polymerase III subunit beta [Microbacteriaceae bacterium]
MKFQANKDVLSQAVIFVTKLLAAKPATAALSGVRIESDVAGNVTLASYDHDVSTRTTISVEGSEAGAVLVSGRLLAEIVTRLPGDTVTLSVIESKLHVTSGSAKFSMSLMAINEYPNLPEVPEPIGTFDGETFSDAIAQVGVAALRDDGLPAMMNISVEISPTAVSLTATDRYRIASRDIPWTAGKSDETQQVLVPARVLMEAGKMFQSADTVTLSLLSGGERELIALSVGSRVVTSSLAKGQFPRVRALLDEKGPGEGYAIVLASDLIDATKRVSLVVERESVLKYTFSSEGALLETQAGETASASEIVDAHVVGDEVTVWLKPRLVIDGITGAHSQFVRLGFTASNEVGKAGPVLFTAHSSRDAAEVQKDYRYLMQPNFLAR